jgi:hypothetical protein
MSVSAVPGFAGPTLTLPQLLTPGKEAFYALKGVQGAREVITIQMPLIEVPEFTHRPVAGVPLPGQRMVDQKRAQAFADYILERPDWVSPPVILRVPQPPMWHPLVSEDSSSRLSFGVTWLARKINRAAELDGQHRVLGICLAVDRVQKINLDNLRQELLEAEQDNNLIDQERLKQEIAQAEIWLKRLSEEVLVAQIMVEDDELAYKQAFFDIADNAKGIQSTLKITFDRGKLLNRAFTLVYGHELLDKRVDLQNDRVLGSNKNWLSAKAVVDVMRALQTDRVDGRITDKREKDLSEQQVADATTEFLDDVVASLPVKDDNGDLIVPEQLRQTSLLGSAPFMRVLASAYHVLLTKHHWTRDQVREYFTELAPRLTAPVREGTPGEIWVKALPDVFSPGSTSPNSRNQQLSAAVDTIVAWGLNQPRQPRWAPPSAISTNEDEVAVTTMVDGNLVEVLTR